jgi:P-type conjugative transfer protein TrbG
MKKAILFLSVFFFAISCSSEPPVIVQIPDKPNPSREDELKNLPATNVDIKVVDFNLPENTGSDDASTNGGNASSIVAVNNLTYTVSPTKEDFSGGAVAYNFVPNNTYKIFCAPFKIVDIQLEPGENIVSPPVSGRQELFNVFVSFSTVNNVRQQHVYIKCAYAGKETNLFINTDRRIYQFALYSFKDLYMPIVSFNYPIDSMKAFKQNLEDQQRKQLYLTGSITDFNFSYNILPMSVHKPAWMPSIVFDDGKKTYIHFASAKRASYAPVFFIIEDGKRILCNYRVVGDYYIIDQTFEHAELVLDVNANNIVSVIKQK